MRPIAIVRNLKILYSFSTIIIESHSIDDFLPARCGKACKSILRISILVYNGISTCIHNPLFSRIFWRCCGYFIRCMFINIIRFYGCGVRNRTYFVRCFTFNGNYNFCLWLQRINHKTTFADKLFICHIDGRWIALLIYPSNLSTDTRYNQLSIIIYIFFQICILDDNILCRSLSSALAYNREGQCLVSCVRKNVYTAISIHLLANR